MKYRFCSGYPSQTQMQVLKARRSILLRSSSTQIARSPVALLSNITRPVQPHTRSFQDGVFSLSLLELSTFSFAIAQGCRCKIITTTCLSDTRTKRRKMPCLRLHDQYNSTTYSHPRTASKTNLQDAITMRGGQGQLDVPLYLVVRCILLVLHSLSEDADLLSL